MNLQKIEKVVTDGTLFVNDIYASVQGEGPLVGRPCVFLRLAGCTLRCRYCDTDYERGVQWGVERLVEWILTCCDSQPLLVLTGGEPLRQPAVIPVLARLMDQGWQVQVETSGSVCPPDWLPILERLTIVCSPKTGKVDRYLLPHVHYWKYVVEQGGVDWADGLPNRSPQTGRQSRVQRPPLHTPLTRIYVGPCWDDTPSHYTANLETALRSVKQFGYTLNLQVHKWIGVK